MTFDRLTLRRIRAAAYRAGARLLIKHGEQPGAAILYAAADALTHGVPEPLTTFQGVQL